jgi:hypothetical protein
VNDVILEHRKMIERLRRELAVSRELKRVLRDEMNKLRSEVRRFRLHS